MSETNHTDGSIAGLLKSGRYLDAIRTIEDRSRGSHRPTGVIAALLADALQRVGNNALAEDIATRLLRASRHDAHLSARCHFILGNAHKERGNFPKAIEHLHVATNYQQDLDLVAWSSLRLIGTIAEASGYRAAFARLDDVKRSLTKCGDARPFVALHLWLVEAESTNGDLENAWRHLRIANSLLTKIDDLWLRGYFACSSAALYHYSGNTDEAWRWLQVAIDCANQSGHRATKRSAYGNLGYFEMSRGSIVEAENAFEVALKCCEPGSAHEIGILDHIAETKLCRGDLEGCRAILLKLDSLSNDANDAKRKQYGVWAAQTKVRLLLSEGKAIDARRLADRLHSIIDDLPQARLTTECRVLVAEALLSSDTAAAAKYLCSIREAPVTLTPDLYADAERVTGHTLATSGNLSLAKNHLERAVRMFDAIGHSNARRGLLELINSVAPIAGESSPSVEATAIDRIRALLDMRPYAALFGREALLLLEALGCATSATLSIDGSIAARFPSEATSHKDQSVANATVVVDLGSESKAQVVLSFEPRPDASSRLIASTFERVISQILSSRFTGSRSSVANEVVWPESELTQEGAVFASDVMFAVLRTAKQVAPTDVSVLITGETGTGKEVVAQTIHRHSLRAGMPFLAMNCAAVPRELLESQLYGHRKGAFSGATEHYQGIIRAANGGTLFLDEIGEMPLDMQAKLLRFLELNEVQPVGEPHPVKVDVRLLFATNDNLENAVNEKRFRPDLFYRLNVIPIRLPPLRDRREEIPVLANFFARRFAAEFSKEPLQFSDAAMHRMIFHDWPGNVRQLSNEIRRLAAILPSGAIVSAANLSSCFKEAGEMRQQEVQTTPSLTIGFDQSLDSVVASIETAMIKHALRTSKGHVTDAAKALGLSRKGLYLKRMRLGLIDFDGKRD